MIFVPVNMKYKYYGQLWWKSLVSLISKRYSPVRGQIYLLKIASIYCNFTLIGGCKMAILGYFLEK